MTDLESAVAETAAILDELTIPYMLIGALAVAAWGQARATLDVHGVGDLFATLPAERDLIVSQDNSAKGP
jgi:hypothetical protein